MEEKMKRLLSIVTLLGITGLGFGLTAAAQNQPGQSPSSSAQQQQQQPPDTQAARSFEGKISKAGDKLVLQESSTRQAYQLDDQDKAKQFEGKNVKVTATMDPNTNTLHVVDIAPAER
jgi:uncharacterized protein DUF5818